VQPLDHVAQCLDHRHHSVVDIAARYQHRLVATEPPEVPMSLLGVLGLPQLLPVGDEQAPAKIPMSVASGAPRRPAPRPQPASSPIDRNAVLRSIEDAWQNLNDLNDSAVGIIEEAGGGVPEPAEARGPASSATSAKTRRKLRPARNTPEIKAALQKVANGGGSLAREAKAALERIEAVQKELQGLNAELRNLPLGAKPTSPGGGDGPGQTRTNEPDGAGEHHVSSDLTSTANEYSQRATELAETSKAIDAEASGFKKEAADLRRAFDSGKLDADTFLKKNGEIEAKVSSLATRREALAGQASSLEAEAESIVARLGSDIPGELEATFKTSNPREILQQVRAGRGSALLGSALGVLGVVATGYVLVQSIRYVLDAKGGLAKAERALEVGGTLAVSAEIQGLVAQIAESGAIGAVFMVALSLDDRPAIERKREARAAQLAQMDRQERRAIGAFLEKTAPGSVLATDVGYAIVDQALWNKTVAEVHEMQAAERSKGRAKLLIQARDIGVADGRAGIGFVRAGELKEWDAVKNSDDPKGALTELLQQYQAGYKTGNADQAALIERTRRWGDADAKVGKRRDRDALLSSQETAKLVMEGTLLTQLLSKLYAAYDLSYTTAAMQLRASKSSR
jgi:hypothetical protein